MAFNLSTLLLRGVSPLRWWRSLRWSQVELSLRDVNLEELQSSWFTGSCYPIPKSQISKPICFYSIGTNPEQPPTPTSPTPTPTPTSTMGCQAIAWFWRNLWVPVPFSLQTCVLKLVGLGSKQPWNAWPAPMVSGHEGNQWFSLSLKKALFLGRGGSFGGEYPQNSHDYKDDLLGHYDMVAHVVFVLRLYLGIPVNLHMLLLLDFA